MAISSLWTGTVGGDPAFSGRMKDRQTSAMNDTGQFATAMLAIAFTVVLLVTGQLFIEQRVQRDIVYVTSQLLRPL
jgi:hypothetical protein